jgi:hypothetical protein
MSSMLSLQGSLALAALLADEVDDDVSPCPFLAWPDTLTTKY